MASSFVVIDTIVMIEDRWLLFVVLVFDFDLLLRCVLFGCVLFVCCFKKFYSSDTRVVGLSTVSLFITNNPYSKNPTSCR